MDITIPAPGTGSTDTPAASQVTAQDAEQVKTPQAETPAGSEQAAAPEQQAAPGEDPLQDDDDPTKPKTWKEKRQERNRARWQEYKAAKEVIPARLQVLEREFASLRGSPPPDFSQISDPTEEIAKRAAWEVRQQSVEEKKVAIEHERAASYQEQQHRMYSAWEEAKADARERIPDFDAVVTEHTPIHPRAAPFIVESEKGAEIAYWLGKNVAAANKLAQQFETAPAQALIELGRIEARVSAPPAKSLSTAPKPAPTLGGGVNPLGFDPNKSSTNDMADYLRKAGVIR